MGLEDILAPAKWLDKQILAQYTRAAVKLEEKNADKDSVVVGVAIGGIATNVLYLFWPREIVEHNLLESTLNFAWGPLSGHDIAYTFYKLRHETVFASERADDALVYFSRKIQRAARLPVLSAGIFSYSLITYSFLANYFGQQFSIDVHQFPGVGAGLIALATSMYLKDINPALLERKPILERAYDRFSQFFGRRAALPDAA